MFSRLFVSYSDFIIGFGVQHDDVTISELVQVSVNYGCIHHQANTC